MSIRIRLASATACVFLLAVLACTESRSWAAVVSFLDFGPGAATSGAQYKAGEPDIDEASVATTVAFRDTIAGETFDIRLEFEGFSDAFGTTGKIEVKGNDERFGIDTGPPSTNGQNFGANGSENEGVKVTWVESYWVSGPGLNRGLSFDGWKEVQLATSTPDSHEWWDNDDTAEVDGVKYNANNHTSHVLGAANSSTDLVLDLKALVAEEGDGSAGDTETKFKIDGFAANVSTQATSPELFRYDFTGHDQSDSWNPGGGDPGIVVENVEFSNFTKVGLGEAVGGTDVFNGKPWPTDSAPLDLGKYYEFTVGPESGYLLDLDDVRFEMVNRGGGGPRRWVVRSSLDGFTANLPGEAAGNITIEAGNVFFLTQDVSAATGPVQVLLTDPIFGALTLPTTFRIYAFNAESTGSGWMVDNVGLFGAVTSAIIPEPTTLLIWSLLAGLGIGVGWGRRRRTK